MLPAQTAPLRPPPEIRRRAAGQWLLWAAVLLIIGLSFQGSEVNFSTLLDGVGNSWRYIFGDPARPLSGFFPPDFSKGGVYVAQMILTVKMAVLGTVGAVILALPLGFLAARNTTPSGLVYQLTRRLLDVLRGLNEFVLALIFVAAVGLGPFPGILALVFHTTGFWASCLPRALRTLTRDRWRRCGPAALTPCRCWGAASGPQIAAHVLSMSVYRFESNVRAATVLGLVGAAALAFTSPRPFAALTRGQPAPF